jgi:hypothetical protein
MALLVMITMPVPLVTRVRMASVKAIPNHVPPRINVISLELVILTVEIVTARQRTMAPLAMTAMHALLGIPVRMALALQVPLSNAQLQINVICRAHATHRLDNAAIPTSRTILPAMMAMHALLVIIARMATVSQDNKRVALLRINVICLVNVIVKLDNAAHPRRIMALLAMIIINAQLAIHVKTALAWLVRPWTVAQLINVIPLLNAILRVASANGITRITELLAMITTLAPWVIPVRMETVNQEVKRLVMRLINVTLLVNVIVIRASATARQRITDHLVMITINAPILIHATMVNVKVV